jgi:hypothetical protein
MAARGFQYGQQPEVDPMSVQGMRKDNRKQFMLDALRNATGLPEVALTMGTSLADMAGTGLGTLAGMAKQKLSGDKVDLEAATDTLQEGKFTFQPRSKGAQETLRGLGTVMEPLEKGAQWVGQTTAEKTGSPALGAAAYTALNVLDPELLAPGAAKVAALRGAQNVARDAARTAVPMSEALSNVPQGQRGAYTLEDLADTEGDYRQRSSIDEALAKLKPQEQKARGPQMLKVLQKYGAKKGELEWTGLETLLAQDIPVSADDIRAQVADFGVQVEPAYRGTSSPEVPKGAAELSDDDIAQKAHELTSEDSDLEYPVAVTRGGDHVDTYDTHREAERAVEQMKESDVEQEVDYYLENIGEYFNEEQLAEMSDDAKQQWAEESARTSVEDNDNYSIDTDYEADARNYDNLYEYWETEIRRRPQDYGLGEGSGDSPAGKWGEYVVESPGGDKGTNYGETIMRLTREGKYGRGANTPDLVNTPVNPRSALQEARVGLLRQQKDDPLVQGATNDYQYTTHFPETNPLVYTRQTDIAEPFGEQSAGSMRMVEELQSDWGQQGRKKGIYDPEVEAARREKVAGQIGPKMDEWRTALLGNLRNLPEQELAAIARRRGWQPEGFLEQVERDLSQPPEAALSAGRSLGHDIYMVTGAPAVEQLGTAIQQQANALRNEFGFGDATGDKLPPAPFIGDAKKFSQLGMQQAIADAVQRGDQYVGVTPGYVHAPERWGSEDLSWWTPDEQQAAPVPVEGQGEMFGEPPTAQPSRTRMVSAQSGSYDTTRGNKWAETIRQLRQKDDPTGDQGYGQPNTIKLDLDAEGALDQLTDLVRSNLAYEASQYNDPAAFIKARAEKVFAAMREQGEGQYSPRSHGMNEFYDKMVPGALEKILKESGSTGSGKGVQRFAEAPIGKGYAMVFDETENAWRPRELNSKSEMEQYAELARTQPNKYQYTPPQMHYVEIDPELARAAKRGFKLPY